MGREVHHVRYVRLDETAFKFTCIETGRTGTQWVHYLRDGDGGLVIWDKDECVNADHVNVKAQHDKEANRG